MSLPLVLTALFAVAAEAGCTEHPWHRSFAEIDVRVDPARLEVALRVDAFDFEQHLGSLTRKTVDLDRPGEVAVEVERYLERTFLVRSRSGRWGELDYLGLEADITDCWLYFEVALPPGPGPLQLSNQVLFERNAFQSNQLLVRAEDFGVVLACTAQEPWQALSGIRLPAPTRVAGWCARPRPIPGLERFVPPRRAVTELGPLGR
ncbi:MAG: DUF6702 family protein [Planctomycetota bacterium]|jgi:hypothetical protein